MQYVSVFHFPQLREQATWSSHLREGQKPDRNISVGAGSQGNAKQKELVEASGGLSRASSRRQQGKEQMTLACEPYGSHTRSPHCSANFPTAIKEAATST